MYRQRLHFWNACLLLIALVLSSSVWGLAQESPGPSYYGNVQLHGLPDDWSHHYSVFSNPGTEEQAKKNGTYQRWLQVVNNPRYVLQQLKHRASTQGPSAGDVARFNSDILTHMGYVRGRGEKNPPPNTPHRDWAVSLGTKAALAPNMYPAGFTGGGTPIGSNGPPATGNCLNDFVVFGVNTAGSASQANLVAIDDLYSDASNPGICGSTPNVKWAYNTSTLATAGAVTTSPILSGDGTQVAFVESSASGSALHILKWEDSTGSVASPATPVNYLNGAGSYLECSAPCMATFTYSTHTTTYSSPYYNYGNDTLYIADDNGTLYSFTGVFLGTPAAGTSHSIVSGSPLVGPNLDYASGNLFLGGVTNGILYSVASATLTLNSTVQVGSGGTGGGIRDVPMVDSSNATVIAFTAANAAGVGKASANTAAVAAQFSTSSLTSPQVAILGEGTLGSTANLNVVGGSFDNNYFNWSGSGANDGVLYMIGTASGSTAPTLYQVPYSGITVSLTRNGAGYKTPSVSLSGGGGSGASVTVSGVVDTLSVSGSGFTGFPMLSFGAPTSGVTATGTVNIGVTSVNISSAGTNLTALPTVNFSPTVTNPAAASLTLGVVGLDISDGGSYTVLPSVTFNTPAGGSHAAGSLTAGLSGTTVTQVGCYLGTSGGAGPTPTYTGTATITSTLGTTLCHTSGSNHYYAVSTINITYAGTGYTSIPTLTFSSTNCYTGCPAKGTVSHMVVNGITMSSAGTNYTSRATVTPSGGTGSGLSATAYMEILTVGITNAGSYPPSTFPAASLTNGGDASLGSVVADIISSSITAAGSGYTSAPTVTVSGAGGSGTGTATINVSSLSYYGGGDYSTAPTVTIGCTSCTPTTAALASASVNAGGVMTAGTPLNTYSTFSASSPDLDVAGVQASPLTEIYTAFGDDLVYFGMGLASTTGGIVAQNVTGGSIGGAVAVTEPDAAGGTSGIVMDNISAAALEDSNIYFTPLAESSIPNSTPTVVNVTGVSAAPGISTSTYTATVTSTSGLANGASVTIAGVQCSGGGTPPCSTGFGTVQPNGTFTISGVTGTTFQYTSTADVNFSAYSFQANTGTTTFTGSTSAFAAVKLTQSGLD